MTTTAQQTPTADHRKPWRYTAPDQTITAGVETITPELASDYLEKQYTNRHLSQNKIQEYAEKLENGRWTLTGESVIFNTRGQLIDGQHRCWACIIAGVPFETIVVRGVKAEAFDDLGSGKQRTAADLLSIHGYKDCNRLASTITYLKYFAVRGDFYQPGVLMRNGRPQKSDILQFADEHPGVIESNRQGQRKGLRFNGTSNTLMAAIHYLTTTADPEDAEAFWYAFESGADLSATSPIYHLRKRLHENGASNRRISQNEIGALIIKAWNAWRDGKPMGMLAFRPGGSRPEAFPTISGLNDSNE